jgi:hypothetical protein
MCIDKMYPISTVDASMQLSLPQSLLKNIHKREMGLWKVAFPGDFNPEAALKW